MESGNTAPCDHALGVRFEAATGEVRCPRCGAVWLDRAAVQAQNRKVARSVNQALGTLLGGTKSILGK